MQVIRTVVWIVITAILVAFVAMNWRTAPVNFWPVEDGYLHFEWPVGVIAILFFILGFLPMWLLNRAQGWRLKRRVSSLENSLRAAATVSPVAQNEIPNTATQSAETKAITQPGDDTGNES